MGNNSLLKNCLPSSRDLIAGSQAIRHFAWDAAVKPRHDAHFKQGWRMKSRLIDLIGKAGAVQGSEPVAGPFRLILRQINQARAVHRMGILLVRHRDA
jgi:hypothetical protein